eukprot:1185057-Prorocentrum_minimum.AAC.1
MYCHVSDVSSQPQQYTLQSALPASWPQAAPTSPPPEYRLCENTPISRIVSRNSPVQPSGRERKPMSATAESTFRCV